MMGMYKLAQEQAANVKEMVELLRSLTDGLKVVTDNQVNIYKKLDELTQPTRLQDKDDSLNDDDYDDVYDVYDDYEEYECDCDICLERLEEEEEEVTKPTFEDIQ